MWLKYRYKFSYRVQDWEWIDIGELPNNRKERKSIIDYKLENICRKYDHSEHFRGVDYKLSKLPPIDILRKKIKDIKAEISNLQNYIRTLKNLEKQIVGK